MTSCPSAACGDIYSVGDSFTVNTGPNLGCLSQTLPLYGHVWWLDRSVFMGRRMESFKYDIHPRSFTVKTRTKKYTTWRYFVSGVIAQPRHKTTLVLWPQCKQHYEKVLEDVSSYTPRYMEEMEAIFEQAQEEERKRMSFLKQTFLSIHRHLDVTNNERWAAPSARAAFHCVFLRIMFSRFWRDEDEK